MVGLTHPRLDAVDEGCEPGGTSGGDLATKGTSVASNIDFSAPSDFGPPVSFGHSPAPDQGVHLVATFVNIAIVIGVLYVLVHFIRKAW